MNTTQWDFPTLAYVWEYRDGAIMAGAAKLDALNDTDREHALTALTERIELLVGPLDDSWLVATSFFMVEDLFKSFFRLERWTPGVTAYIAATATVVVVELTRRGLVLHYVVDATQGRANLSAMLAYLPAIFDATGLAVVVPQLLATEMLIRDEGHPPEDIASIQRYRDEGHAIADQIIARWHQERRSSAYLNLDLDDDSPALSLDAALSQRDAPGTIVVFRNQPPIEGSTAHISPPPGIALPTRMPE